MTPPVSPHTIAARLYHAFTKGSGLYPLKASHPTIPVQSNTQLTLPQGIYFYLSHPFLYPLLRSRLIPASLLSLFILFNLFFWTYLIQVAFLALWQGKSAWFNATVLVLGESAAITALLFEAFFVDETQVDVFDTVLVAKGYASLVGTSRPVAPDEEGELTPLQRLGRPVAKAEFAPFSFRQIAELVLLLPVNFVPFVGVPLFLLGTGYRAGPLLMWRYYKLRGWTRSERQEWIRRRRWEYAWFGMCHLVLQLVPVLNMFFLLTTAAGAGLFAVEEERVRLLREEDGEGGAERLPVYTDEPV